MKCRLFLMLIGLLMVTKPAEAFLPVLTTDPLGIVQGVQKIKGEVDRLKQSVAAGKTLQKTMTAIGTAKETVSNFITNANKFIADKKKKIAEYKKQVADYKAKAAAAKKRAQKIKQDVQKAKQEVQNVKNKIDEGKEAIENTKKVLEGSGYKIDQSGNIIDGLGNIVKSKEGQQQSRLNKSQNIFVAKASYHISMPVAFADLLDDDDDDEDDKGPKSGETKDGVLIVPESIAMSGVEECELDYEQAMEPMKMNECLRAANALKYKKDERTQQESEDILRNLENGLLEYYASSFFEAFNIYNETLTFKTNVYDPIVNQDINTVQDAWKYTKEMGQKLGDQINVLAKLWSRESASQLYKVYWDEGLGAYDEKDEDDSDSKQG